MKEENVTELAVYQRVESLISERKVSVTKFASTIGVSQTTLNQQLNKKSITLVTLLAILKTFPEVSAEWLMRGNSDNPSVETMDVESLKEEIARKDKHIAFLYDIAADYKSKYDKLTKQ